MTPSLMMGNQRNWNGAGGADITAMAAATPHLAGGMWFEGERPALARPQPGAEGQRAIGRGSHVGDGRRVGPAPPGSL